MDRRPDRPAFVDAPTEGMLWGGVSGRRVDAHAQGVGINMCSFSPFRIRWVYKASKLFQKGPSSSRGLPHMCFSIQDPRLIDPGPENRSREQKLRKNVRRPDIEDKTTETHILLATLLLLLLPHTQPIPPPPPADASGLGPRNRRVPTPVRNLLKNITTIAITENSRRNLIHKISVQNQDKKFNDHVYGSNFGGDARARARPVCGSRSRGLIRGLKNGPAQFVDHRSRVCGSTCCAPPPLTLASVARSVGNAKGA